MGFRCYFLLNDIQFISKFRKDTKPEKDEKLPEELIFDKAIKADKIDDKIDSLEKIDKEISKYEYLLDFIKNSYEIKIYCILLI